MGSLPPIQGRMGGLPPLEGSYQKGGQGIPKHLSPEHAASAPHSQEAAHPSGEAKTDEVIESVVRGETRVIPSPQQHAFIARQERLNKDISRFNEIFSWYTSGGDPNCKNAPRAKTGRKRPNTELEPYIKTVISELVENEAKRTATSNVKDEKWRGANPLKKMEMMTKSPAFELTTISNLSDPRKESRSAVDECVSSPSTSVPVLPAPPPVSQHPSTFPSLVSPFAQPQFIPHPQYAMHQYPSNGVPPHGFPPQFPSPSFVSPTHPQSFHHPYQQFPRPFPYPS